MSQSFIVELFLRRDKEIKELVVQTLARSYSQESTPTAEEVAATLAQALNLNHQNQVAELSKEIVELRLQEEQSRLKCESNNETIKWLRAQYEKILDEQRAAYEARLDQLETTQLKEVAEHKGQAERLTALNQSLKSEAASDKVIVENSRANEHERLRRIADMVPQLIKQF